MKITELEFLLHLVIFSAMKSTYLILTNFFWLLLVNVCIVYLLLSFYFQPTYIIIFEWVSYKYHIVGSFKIIHSTSFCHLIGIYRSSIETNHMSGPTSTILFNVFCSPLCFLFFYFTFLALPQVTWITF